MKSVVIGLSPNIERDDVFEAFTQLIKPWSWNSLTGARLLEKWFCHYFSIENAVSIHNARSALYALLQAFGIQKGDEVLLQAFTCVVVPNAITALGAKPVYVDIDNTLTIDVQDLEKKITKRTKAIIVQHTFGIAADMEAIQRIAKKQKLFIIEDVAHTIGASYKGKKLGTLSDAAIFSFGRDKAFSSVFGGVAITVHKEIGKKLRILQSKCSFPEKRWTLQQLFHPIFTWFILKFYDTANIGKIMLILLQKMRILSFPVSAEEREGKFSPHQIYLLSNPLALMALHQLKKIEKYNKKREYISKLYHTAISTSPFDRTILRAEMPMPLLRYPLLVENPQSAYVYCRKQQIYLGNWYHCVVDPKGSIMEKAHYNFGSCPKAEYAAKHIVNLPMNPTMQEEDVARVVHIVKEYYKMDEENTVINYAGN